MAKWKSLKYRKLFVYRTLYSSCIDLPILRIWSRLFTLSDLLEQIKVYFFSYHFTTNSNSNEDNKDKNFQLFSIKNSEVHESFINAPIEQKQSHDGLNVLIANIPSLKKAQEAALDSKKKSQEERIKIFNTTSQMFDKAENIRKMSIEKTNLFNDLSKTLTKEQRLDELKTKIYFIQQENERYEAELRSLNPEVGRSQDFSIENIIKYRNIQQKIIINQKLIQYNQDLIASITEN